MPHTGGNTTRRRHPLRDRDVTAAHTTKLGTWVARAFFVVVESELDQTHQLVLLAMAHHMDILSVAGQPQVVYPEDVADLVGIASSRAGGLMATLKRGGFLDGSAQGGYGFGRRMDTED